MKATASVLVATVASLALLACGSSGSPPSSSTARTPASAPKGSEKGRGGGAHGQALAVEADPGGRLAYVPSRLTANAGNVTIDFKNPQGVSHDIAVEGPNGKAIGKSELLAEGSTTVALSNLKPGTYHYYCTVPGHREAGMEGTLSVR